MGEIVPGQPRAEPATRSRATEPAPGRGEAADAEWAVRRTLIGVPAVRASPASGVGTTHQRSLAGAGPTVAPDPEPHPPWRPPGGPRRPPSRGPGAARRPRGAAGQVGRTAGGGAPQ